MGRYSHLGAWGAMRKTDYDVIAWAMERVGLMPLRSRTLPTLSGGERQRVFIARALAQQSPILLLDEPVSGLDIGRQLELMALLTNLHAEGRTILASMHDLRPAVEFFSQAILLDHGQIVDRGPTERVIDGPALSTAFGVRVHRAEQLAFRVRV
jgi:iron complex transport system ATP-binding protein